MSDARGRWFRIYARSLRSHVKFRELTALELGAWLALRAECELRDEALLVDEAEAVLVLRRRRIGRPHAVLARLVDLRLFDVADDGSVSVHDRADHDRPVYPSDAPEETRKRKRLSRDVTTRDTDSHDTHARGQPQQAEPSIQLQPQQAEGLPDEGDPVTVACRMFLDGGRWLSDREYVDAWEVLARKHGQKRVLAAIQPAYATLLETKDKVRPWDLKRQVDLDIATAARERELDYREARAKADREVTERLRRDAEAATPEEKERSVMVREAIRLWVSERPNDPVPEDIAELASWLQQHRPNGKEAHA